MIKYMGIWSVKPGLDLEETWKVYREHVALAKETLQPELKKYIVNRVIETETGISGVVEMWYEDLESAKRALSRLRAIPDEFSKRITAQRLFAQGEEIKL